MRASRHCNLMIKVKTPRTWGSFAARLKAARGGKWGDLMQMMCRNRLELASSREGEDRRRHPLPRHKRTPLHGLPTRPPSRFAHEQSSGAFERNSSVRSTASYPPNSNVAPKPTARAGGR